MANNNVTRLKNQICFPMYACSREVVKKYTSYLEKVDLTYTQYITMLVVWEEESITSKEMGKRLHLDSGTLTPLLKKLEAKGFITRSRMREDERNLLVTITEKGTLIKKEVADIPRKIREEIAFTSDESAELYRLLYKLMDHLEN